MAEFTVTWNSCLCYLLCINLKCVITDSVWLEALICVCMWFNIVRYGTKCPSCAIWWYQCIDVCYDAINSLAPGRFENNFQNVFFKLISWIDTLSNSCKTVLRRMPQNLSDDKSTLVQVMAWCRQATSHYLNQCCPRPLSPYGVTRPQWVNASSPGATYMRYWVIIGLDNGLAPFWC